MEVEIKAKCDETRFEEIKNKLIELGGTKEKDKHQIDQYYNLPHEDLRGTKRYVRVRQEGEGAILAFHENVNESLTNEYETRASDNKMLETILAKFGLTKLGLIDKYREKFKLNEFEICLDRVKDIGTFVEIETDGDESNCDIKRQECIDLLNTLGLNESDLTNEFLCDIATKP
ncbi:MAG: class IV adenylate cyclase [Candidatus Diapherotrites archaeon]|jgi:adenylate cyclase, class 2|nr:class IV adenylate cyclase [Candidatus Diapherotrites archaeon]MBT4596580.1 class IV adenylate cyclase [Candidatus Diapherotrites archaeon]